MGFGCLLSQMSGLLVDKSGNSAVTALLPAGARDIVTVRSIDGLNLEIEDGDRIGLVGHNGSGQDDAPTRARRTYNCFFTDGKRLLHPLATPRECVK